MLKIIFILAVIALTAVQSLPIEPSNDQNPEVRILRNERENFEDGSYRFAYETSDGQKREEKATVYKIEGEDPQLVISGLFSYFGPDGVEYKVEYTADQSGFLPQGKHLPKTAEQLAQEKSGPKGFGLPGAAIKSLIG